MTAPTASSPLTGFQRWRSLLFVHWAVPAEVLRPLVAPSLDIDTFEGRAFVGLVAFDIPEMRPVRRCRRRPRRGGSSRPTCART